MEIVDEEPLTGEFVVIWEFEGSLYSDSYKRNYDKSLSRYDNEEDEWINTNLNRTYAGNISSNIRYVVKTN